MRHPTITLEWHWYEISKRWRLQGRLWDTDRQAAPIACYDRWIEASVSMDQAGLLLAMDAVAEEMLRRLA